MSMNPSTASRDFAEMFEYAPERCYICGKYVAEDEPSGINPWDGVAHMKCIEESEDEDGK